MEFVRKFCFRNICGKASSEARKGVGNFFFAFFGCAVVLRYIAEGKGCLNAKKRGMSM